MSEKRQRSFRRRARRWVARVLVRLAVLVAPRIYRAYMGFVFATSRVHENDVRRRIAEVGREHDGVVCLLWHEEVFSVAYTYTFAGVRPHTLANAGDAGEVIAAVLESCGYVVFRGGSQGGSRRRNTVLLEMIRHMKKTPQVVYGITVDGSKGPAYHMKPGGIAIARSCEKPVLLVRTWYRRCLRLRTWDRTAIPLPFNEIAFYLRGPYTLHKRASSEELEDFRQRMESELVALAALSYDELGQARPAGLVEQLPASLDSSR